MYIHFVLIYIALYICTRPFLAINAPFPKDISPFPFPCKGKMKTKEKKLTANYVYLVFRGCIHTVKQIRVYDRPILYTIYSD